MQIQVEDKVFRLRPNWDDEIEIELPGSDKLIYLRVGTFGLRGLTVLLPELYTYAVESNSRRFTILDDPLYPAGIELDVGGGEILKLGRLEYLELEDD